MSGCLKWFLIIGIIALMIEYWYIVLPILAIVLFLSYKIKNTNTSNVCCDNNIIISQDYDFMNGHEFENYCAIILKQNGFSHVTVTKGSGDFGIDILATKDNWIYAIQCKNYSSKVGNHAVQEAYSGKDYYNADIAVVMTNNFFTLAAVEAADSLNVELWDRGKLDDMINKTATNKINEERGQKPELSERALRKLEEHRLKEFKVNQIQNAEIITKPSEPHIVEIKEKEDTAMYDEEKGIFPSGEYIVGEDIPLGKYILTQRNEKSQGEIHIYKDYQSYLKNQDSELILKLFTGDYHLSFRTERSFLVVENADMQKI